MSAIQHDLFLDYPNTPGHRGVDTSIAAAKAVTPKSRRTEDKILEALRVRERTSWELACDLGIAFHTVQPCTSQLKAKHKIEDSGRRGPARSPHLKAIVWRLVTETPA